MSAPTTQPSPPPRPGRGLTRLMIVLLIAITVGPCVYVEAPREVARWYLAAAREEREAGRNDVAEKKLEQALKWTPDSADLLLERARWRLFDGDLKAALADCQRVAELRPDDFRMLFVRSFVLQQLGRHDEAQADWKAIDRLSRVRGVSREEWEIARLAIAEDRQAGRKEQAYERLGMLIGWTPGEAALLFQRAQWRKADRQYAAALDDYNAILKLQPDNPQMLVLRSEVLQHLGRHKEAIADWKALQKMSADGKVDRTMVLNGLAYARAVGNVDVDAGLKQANEALEAEPGDAAILDTRGFLLYRQGKYDAALKDMNAAVKGMDKDYQQWLHAKSQRSPTDKLLVSEPSLPELNLAVGYYHRSLVLEKLEETEKAEADRLRAKKLIGREPDETLF
jgi:tetratricopeptide (TPR) repeat protein